MITREHMERRIKELKRQRAKREKRKLFVKNVALGIIVVVAMVIFTNSFLDAWCDEIDAHAEYNRNYIQEMESHRTGK